MDDQNCPICFEKLTFPTSSCENGHTFHRHCIFSWNQSNLACPICRTRYYPPAHEEYCAFRYYQNPSPAEAEKIININPWQIRHVKPEDFPDHYEKLWDLAVSRAPPVIKFRTMPPKELRMKAILLSPVSVVLLEETSLEELVFAFFTNKQILSSLLVKINLLTVYEKIIFALIAINVDVENVKFFDMQVAYDYAFSLNPESVVHFKNITLKTCETVLVKCRKMLPHCMSRLPICLWFDMLRKKPSLIQHYFKSDLSVVLFALKCNLRAFFYLNYKHRIAPKVVEFVLTKSRGKFIKYVPQNFINCKKSISSDRQNLKLISSPSRKARAWMRSLKVDHVGEKTTASCS